MGIEPMLSDVTDQYFYRLNYGTILSSLLSMLRTRLIYTLRIESGLFYFILPRPSIGNLPQSYPD